MKSAKKFGKDLKKDIHNQLAIARAVRFVSVFAISFLVIMNVVIPLTSGFWDGMGAWHAESVQGILGSAGVESTVSGNILTMEVQGQDVDFLISRLCSGDVEIALLISLLLASFDVLLIWRLVGAFIGTGFLLLMNPLRIAVTLLLTKDSGMEAGDFYHNILFRLFLFVLLVLYYFIWYHIFAKRKCKLQEKICKKIRC